MEFRWDADGLGDLDLYAGNRLAGYLQDYEVCEHHLFRMHKPQFYWTSHNLPNMTLDEAKAVAEALVRLEG